MLLRAALWQRFPILHFKRCEEVLEREMARTHTPTDRATDITTHHKAILRRFCHFALFILHSQLGSSFIAITSRCYIFFHVRRRIQNFFMCFQTWMEQRAIHRRRAWGEGRLRLFIVCHCALRETSNARNLFLFAVLCLFIRFYFSPSSKFSGFSFGAFTRAMRA